MNFWHKLKKPIIILAPMANVTDFAFRQIIAKYGKPDIMYTEFVSAEALSSRGREKVIHDLWFDDTQRPIIAQFFGTKPAQMKDASKLAKELGFDGIDINMGCPDKNVLKQGAGASLIKNPGLAKELVLAAKEGADDLPVSVKTRIGFNEESLDAWLPELLSVNPEAIIIHGRTKKELSEVPAHWDMIAKAVKIRDDFGSKTLIIGNGDVDNLKQAHEYAQKYGVDGVMIGRGIFGNPWLFDENKEETTLAERLEALKEHILLFDAKFKDIKNFDIMKKHFKAYISGFDGAKDLRIKLMESKNAQEAIRIIDNNI